MATRIWSQDQLLALNVRDRDTLVSAAAGSGKTSVLCQRILDRLQDESHPLELSRLLVVTFTNAAAAELRARLQAGIAEALAKKPSAHLRRQSMTLHRAHICTIDKYCIHFVKKHFHLLGVSPDVTVAEDSALSEVKRRTMQKTIDYFYESCPEFADTSDLFITDRDEKNLPDLLIAMHESLSAFACGVGAIEEIANELSQSQTGGVFDGKWGKILKEQLISQIEYYKALCLTTKEHYSACTDKKGNPVGGELSTDIAIADSLLAPLLKDDFQGFQKALAERPAFGRKTLPSKDSFADHFTEARTKFKKLLDSESFALPVTESTLPLLYRRAAQHCHTLHQVLCYYEERLMAEKKRMNMLEFSDMERMTLQLLEDEHGNPTALAAEMKMQFDEIFIDEYQDVNDIQNRIFCALSRGNRFLVGDVKQSIYGFRFADPTIFSDLRNSFDDAEKEDSDTCRIFLQNNYRCDQNVVSFTNAVCDLVFPYCTGLSYLKKDALVYAKASGEKNIPVEVHLTKKSDDFFENAESAEAAFLAKRIQELIADGRNPGDIAILCRSLHADAVEILQKELKQRGIAVAVSGLSGFFEESDILLTLSLLQAVDNPTKDIPLAAIARSALFGFSDTELASIATKRAETLFEKMKIASDEGNAKATELVCRLDAYRRLCLEQGCSALLFSLFEDPHFRMAIHEGPGSIEEKEKRLQYLYGIALESEELSAFLARIERMQSEGLRERKNGGENGNRVQIMTIHASKGLEFPVCCLFNCQRALCTHAPDPSDFDPHMGPAFSLKDPSGFATIRTVQQIAREMEAKNKDLNEEMRILYVALTRAKEHLIITGTPKTAKTDTFVEKCRFLSATPHRLAITENASYLAWIVMAICQNASPDTYALYENGVLTKGTALSASQVQESAEPNDQEVPQKAPSSIDTLTEEVLIARRDFVYPHKIAEKIPAKLSVSTLREDLLDHEGAAMLRSDSAITLAKPRFLDPQKQERDPAKKGVATHAIMQFCDFAFAKAHGAKAEILRQETLGFINKTDAAIADADAIDRFFASDLLCSMEKAKTIRREQRFMITLPASHFTSEQGAEEEELLIQGVIDCYFIDQEDRIWLLDYKTDRFGADMDEAAIEKELIARHGTQMYYYRLALERLLGKKVHQVLIYSFHLNRAVTIPCETRGDLL